MAGVVFGFKCPCLLLCGTEFSVLVVRSYNVTRRFLCLIKVKKHMDKIFIYLSVNLMHKNITSPLFRCV